MAQEGVHLDRETFSCSICLDLLKDPVTVPCGHSYCLDCIQSCWDGEAEGKAVGCPQCRQTFEPRPALVKSTMLAALVEQLKKTGLQAAPADPCYAGPEDVACDVCTGRKVKACKSCLACLASYCEKHLQPHYDAAPLKKHKLVDPCNSLQENICSRHDEVMKMFCRTDQQSICYLCSVGEHKGHDTVVAAEEWAEKQKELQGRQKEIQQTIQVREEDVKLLQQEVEAINGSADKSVEDSEKVLDELILLLQRKRSEVKQQIRSQQEAEVRGVKELEEKLKQEISELKRSEAELEQLAHTEDHNQFLRSYASVSQLGESTASPGIHVRPCRYFEGVTAAVSEVRDKLQDVLRDTWTNILATVSNVDALLSPSEPKTRAEFLCYSCDITLDPNTAHRNLELSNGDRKATYVRKIQPYPDNPDRFATFVQVLSRQSLIGRCYWEVERRGGDHVYVAAAYKNISRSGSHKESQFGGNDKSWALLCSDKGFSFWINNTKTPVSAPPSVRVGVYLDHRAGILSFYSVTNTMTLLHKVQTTFTQPLHAGLNCWSMNTEAEICKLKTN